MLPYHTPHDVVKNNYNSIELHLQNTIVELWFKFTILFIKRISRALYLIIKLRMTIY